MNTEFNRAGYCTSALWSWVMCVIGISLFEIYQNSIIALIPLAIGMLLRKERDKLLAGLVDNPRWLRFTAIYYVVALVFAMFYYKSLAKMDFLLLVIYLLTPTIAYVLTQDIRLCKRNRQNNSQH